MRHWTNFAIIQRRRLQGPTGQPVRVQLLLLQTAYRDANRLQDSAQAVVGHVASTRRSSPCPVGLLRVLAGPLIAVEVEADRPDVTARPDQLLHISLRKLSELFVELLLLFGIELLERIAVMVALGPWVSTLPCPLQQLVEGMDVRSRQRRLNLARHLFGQSRTLTLEREAGLLYALGLAPFDLGLYRRKLARTLVEPTAVSQANL